MVLFKTNYFKHISNNKLQIVFLNIYSPAHLTSSFLGIKFASQPFYSPEESGFGSLLELKGY